MKSVVLSLFVVIALKAYSIDCGRESVDAYWKNASKVYYGKSMSAHVMTGQNNEEYIRYQVKVLEYFKGGDGMENRTVDSSLWGPLPPVGHFALIFEGQGNKIEHCSGTQPFDIDWLLPENSDRADIPQKLVRILKAARNEKP